MLLPYSMSKIKECDSHINRLSLREKIILRGQLWKKGFSKKDINRRMKELESVVKENHKMRLSDLRKSAGDFRSAFKRLVYGDREKEIWERE